MLGQHDSVSRQDSVSGHHNWVPGHLSCVAKIDPQGLHLAAQRSHLSAQRSHLAAQVLYSAVQELPGAARGSYLGVPMLYFAAQGAARLVGWGCGLEGVLLARGCPENQVRGW